MEAMIANHNPAHFSKVINHRLYCNELTNAHNNDKMPFRIGLIQLRTNALAAGVRVLWKVACKNAEESLPSVESCETRAGIPAVVGQPPVKRGMNPFGKTEKNNNVCHLTLREYMPSII